MSEGLSVETHEIRAMAKALSAVRQSFEDAEGIVEEYSDAVGHPRLIDELEEFVDSWDDRRAEMVRAIGQLADAAEEAADTYEEIDDDLGRIIRGEDPTK